ncbi:MAG: hypothetical protein N2445_07105 [Acidobacteria bacterium]|nr:hypothetical protein [Acidobacteriota bacterium]
MRKWFIIFFFSGIAVFLFAQSANCPSAISSLMPKNSVNVNCGYNSAGIVGLGSASAALPFSNPCANQATKTPGKITLSLKHYAGEGVKLFEMQIDSEEEQRFSNEESNFREKWNKIKIGGSVLSKSDLKIEELKGGKIVAFEWVVDCSEYKKQSKPKAYLYGVAHNASTAIDFNIEGEIDLATAKEAADEIISNFQKADFGSFDK